MIKFIIMWQSLKHIFSKKMIFQNGGFLLTEYTTVYYLSDFWIHAFSLISGIDEKSVKSIYFIRFFI